MDNAILWTVRTCKTKGDDTNLPRAVGVPAGTARQKYNEFSRVPDTKVVCYPFFHASISGVIDTSATRTVIEACNGDLWNLVTYDRPDYRLLYTDYPARLGMFKPLYRHIRHVSAKMRGFLEMGKHIYLEWSYARNSDIERNPVGELYVVFYECRVVD